MLSSCTCHAILSSDVTSCSWLYSRLFLEDSQLHCALYLLSMMRINCSVLADVSLWGSVVGDLYSVLMSIARRGSVKQTWTLWWRRDVQQSPEAQQLPAAASSSSLGSSVRLAGGESPLGGGEGRDPRCRRSLGWTSGSTANVVFPKDWQHRIQHTINPN